MERKDLTIEFCGEYFATPSAEDVRFVAEDKHFTECYANIGFFYDTVGALLLAGY
jgi:hypothetical protein